MLNVQQLYVVKPDRTKGTFFVRMYSLDPENTGVVIIEGLDQESAITAAVALNNAYQEGRQHAINTYV